MSVCLTDRPHIKSKTIKGIFSNTGIALCVSNLRYLFMLWSQQHKDNLRIQKVVESLFRSNNGFSGLMSEHTRRDIFDGAANKLLGTTR